MGSIVGIKIRGHGEPRCLVNWREYEASGNCWEPGVVRAVGERGARFVVGTSRKLSGLFLFFIGNEKNELPVILSLTERAGRRVIIAKEAKE